MNVKEWVIFAYGVIFATSTPYLKPKNRYLFPTAVKPYDDTLTFFLGGSGICARIGSVVVNTNLDAAAIEWRAVAACASTLIMSSLTGGFGSAGEVSALGTARVLAHSDSPVDVGFKFEPVDTETVITVGDETVRLIPVRGAATETDLVVYFEKQSVMMFGSLFLNRIHPVLQMGVASRVDHWASVLEDLLARFSPKVCVPGEGVFGEASDVREFVRYLRSLKDPAVEFSYCRQNFDWMEIPRFTSLEENFDILRRNVKTHASLR